MLGAEALDGWDALGPESEEGDEYCGAVGEGEVVSRGGCSLAGERDGRRSGCAPQRGEIEAQRGPWWEVGSGSEHSDGCTRRVRRTCDHQVSFGAAKDLDVEQALDLSLGEGRFEKVMEGVLDV